MANVNCMDCMDCVDCADCEDCVNCMDCTDCRNCEDCTGLTGYEGLHIYPAKEANNPRFTEAIAVLSTVAPWVWVTNVGCRYKDGEMYVIVPKEKVHG